MKLEFYKDKNGEYRWRLRAANNRIVADGGEGYKNEEDCREGWRLVASAGDEFFWDPKNGASRDVELTVVDPCTAHPDDAVCEASGRAGCHA